MIDLEQLSLRIVNAVGLAPAGEENKERDTVENDAARQQREKPVWSSMLCRRLAQTRFVSAAVAQYAGGLLAYRSEEEREARERWEKEKRELREALLAERMHNESLRKALEWYAEEDAIRLGPLGRGRPAYLALHGEATEAGEGSAA